MTDQEFAKWASKSGVPEDPGTVWRICHETMYHSPVREESVRVAQELNEMFDGIETGEFH